MKPFELINHKGKKIGVVDTSGATPEQVLPYLEDAQKKISTMPPATVLVLTDVTNTVYNKVTSDAFGVFAKKNSPYVKASAVVGADGLRAVYVTLVNTLTKREIKACKDRAEAMDWLVSR